MQLVAPPDDPRVRRSTRVGGLSLLQVVDVFDLRVRPEPVVVAAEVGLPIREEDGLVRGAPECRNGEVPPLREEQRGNKNDKRDRDVADAAAI